MFLPNRTQWILTACLGFAAPAFAGTPENQASNDPAFELGQIVVEAQRLRNSADAQTVSAEQIRRFDAHHLAQALDSQSGVSVDFIGGRNETGLRVRGFDSRQAPVFLDGIPQYVPYDGYVDFARFLTPALAKIRVEKSGASLMYGANTLGGAINLLSRKPASAFEGTLEAGADDSGARQFAFNLGGSNERFYAQASFAYSGSKHFRLPKGFRDLKARPTDTGDYRENAAHSDRHYALKLGITPNHTDEYALGYSAVRGEKQQPVYAGSSTQRNTVRFWQWPYWNKDSLYFIGNTQLGERHKLKLRAYRDVYRNGMQQYSDASYRTKSEPLSAYNDQTLGASLQYGWTPADGQHLQLGYQFKSDRHDDNGSRYRDALHHIAAEYQIAFNPLWRVRSGIDYQHNASKEVPANLRHNRESSVNGLLELEYRPNDAHTFYGVVSAKSRFPSIKDRYSARMGRAVPNPDLKSERAYHAELGWRGMPWAGANVQASAFYSRLSNEIQNGLVADTANRCRNSNVRGFCSQAQNIGKTAHAGLELGITQDIAAKWQLGMNYTYLNRKNLSDPADKLRDTPRHKLFAFAEFAPNEQWRAQVALRAESGRYSSYGSGVRELGGFAVYDAKLGWQPLKGVSWDLGVKNIGDRHYELSDGYPMAGRTWFTRLRYAF